MSDTTYLFVVLYTYRFEIFNFSDCMYLYYIVKLNNNVYIVFMVYIIIFYGSFILYYNRTNNYLGMITYTFIKIARYLNLLFYLLTIFVSVQITMLF